MAQDHNYGGRLEVHKDGSFSWHPEGMKLGSRRSGSDVMQYAYLKIAGGDGVTAWDIKSDSYEVASRAGNFMPGSIPTLYDSRCLDHRWQIDFDDSQLSKKWTVFQVVRGYKIPLLKKDPNEVSLIGPMIRVAIGYYDEEEGLSSYEMENKNMKAEKNNLEPPYKLDYPQHALAIEYYDGKEKGDEDNWRPSDTPQRLINLGLNTKVLVDGLLDEQVLQTLHQGRVDFCTVILDKDGVRDWGDIKEVDPSTNILRSSWGNTGNSIVVQNLTAPGAYAMMHHLEPTPS